LILLLFDIILKIEIMSVILVTELMIIKGYLFYGWTIISN